MGLDILVQECLEMNAQLENYQSCVSKKSNFLKDEVIQTFIFDLRDYCNAVKIVEDLQPTLSKVKKEKIEPIDATDVSIILGEHAHLFRDIHKNLEESSEDSGNLRRQLGSIDGIIELNRLMLIDNRQFQQTIKEYDIEIEPTNGLQEEKKGGFFYRLFSKNTK